MPQCHRCAEPVEDEVNFCPHCGTDQRVTIPRVDLSIDEASLESFPLAGRTWLNALIGSIVGFSLGMLFALIVTPLYLTGIFIGGMLAGYFQRRGTTSGGKVGAIAGLFATAPIILLLVVGTLFGLGWVVMSAQQHLEPIIGGIVSMSVLFVLFTFVIVLSAMTNILFGALGGVVGSVVDASPDRSHTR